jgi:hypothetical protein
MEHKSLKNRIKYWYKMRIRMRASRTIIKWRLLQKSLHKSRKPEIDSTQRKAIDLFFALLKNKETNLNYSPESSTRIIESDYVWITMAGRTSDFILNIIDETRSASAHSHEVHIPKEHGFEMSDDFDLELEKRFRSIEAVKKRVVIDDLEKLINKVTNQKK